MSDGDPGHLREVPGGARRADTFLLVIATVVAMGSAIGFRTERPPVFSLFMMGVWFQVAARWLRHVRPRWSRAVDVIGAMFIGAAIYAGVVSR